MQTLRKALVPEWCKYGSDCAIFAVSPVWQLQTTMHCEGQICLCLSYVISLGSSQHGDALAQSQAEEGQGGRRARMEGVEGETGIEEKGRRGSKKEVGE